MSRGRILIATAIALAATAGIAAGGKGKQVRYVNVHPIVKAHGVCRDNEHWYMTIRSQAYTLDTIKSQIQAEADAALEPDIDPAAGKRLSARKVIIRADQFAPYGHIQRIIEMCGQAGMYKIEVGAAKPTKT